VTFGVAGGPLGASELWTLLLDLPGTAPGVVAHGADTPLEQPSETPWCGVAVAAWMRAAGIEPPPNWFRAKAWLAFGMPLSEPVAGCVVVFERPGGGHVGLVTGVDQIGRLLVLGGNQGNAVSEVPFARERVLGYRWPPNQIDLLARAHGRHNDRGRVLRVAAVEREHDAGTLADALPGGQRCPLVLIRDLLVLWC
jgi:uncharacterized protein (TIGR02594 family)